MIRFVDAYRDDHGVELEPIGNVPPAEAEAAYYRELEEPTPIAA